MNKPAPKSLLDGAQEDQAKMDFLAQAGVDPGAYAGVRMTEAEGFELGREGLKTLFQQAMINVARQKHYRPPTVDPEHDLVFGELL